MADPRWLDPAVDPNGRVPGTCFLGDPQVVNNGPIGLARFCSLRSWLSQWSADATQADGLTAAGRISIPALVIENEADDVFICVGVFIHWEAADDAKIQQYNYQATKEAIQRAIAGTPTAAEATRQRNEVKHPFAA